MRELTNEEAHLLSVHRAIVEFDLAHFIATDDASLLASYLPALLELDLVPVQDVPRILNAFVAGFTACRLANASIKPDQLVDIEEEIIRPPSNQTGVDPLTQEVRH